MKFYDFKTAKIAVHDETKTLRKAAARWKKEKEAMTTTPKDDLPEARILPELNAPMDSNEYLQFRALAQEIAGDSIVTRALEKLIVQIVSECVPYARQKERERLAMTFEGYDVPIDCNKLAKALRENKFIFPDMEAK